MSHVCCPSNISSLEAINFSFLHYLLLLKDLNLECQDIKPTLLFYFKLDLIVDDCILLAISGTISYANLNEPPPDMHKYILSSLGKLLLLFLFDNLK
jgi:hypothetical protein